MKLLLWKQITCMWTIGVLQIIHFEDI